MDTGQAEHEKEYMTIEEAASFIGLKRSMLYNRLKQLGIASYKFPTDKKHYLKTADVRHIRDIKERPWLAAQPERVDTSSQTQKPQKSRSATPVGIAEERTETRSTLPDGYMPFTLFFRLHGVPETTAGRYMQSEIIAGKWVYDRHAVSSALDASGQRAFWEKFHERADFKPCPRCPHAER